jgi:hypothetical protein
MPFVKLQSPFDRERTVISPNEPAHYPPGDGAGRPAWRMARTLPPLRLGDDSGVAIECFEAQGTPALPVADGTTIMGYVTQAGVLASMGEEPAGPAPGEPDRRWNRAIRPFSGAVPENATAIQAAAILHSTGEPMLPVVAEEGRLLGCILASDLIAPAHRRAPLPSVGGMATPFGVYLTTAGVSGGAGPWALVSTGVLMGIGAEVTLAASIWLMRALQAIPLIKAWLTQAPALQAPVGEILQLVLFVLFIRLNSLAGFHAAEHQTVHCLEAREPLTPERVATYPRAHPRCGTNLMVMVAMGYCLFDALLAAQSLWPDTVQIVLPLGLLAIYLFRQSIGAFVQQNFTTRPATTGQIQSGIRAARELEQRYNASGGRPASRWRRIWAMGLAQVALGMVGSMLLIEGLGWLWQRVYRL